MRKLVYLIASTLDGFIAEESRADPSGTVFELTGDHAEPLMAEYPEMLPDHVRRMIGAPQVPSRHFDTVLEGRVSWQMAADQGITNAYPHLRHYVVSRTLTELPDPSLKLITGDPVQKVRALKAEEGQDIWLVGGGALAASLRDEIDEIHLKLNPVVLGKGAPLFDGTFGPDRIDRYQLISSRSFASGVALMIYARKRSGSRP